ncbi:MAG TPA: hypothetical protein VGK32_21805 [Vicinamibacterales bacterium]
MDLSRNLRTRSKSGGSYIDAKRLADGAIQRLSSVEIDDKQVLERLNDVMANMEEDPTSWRLLVELVEPHWFVVEPEYRSQQAYRCLTLRIVERMHGAPPDHEAAG